MVVNQGPINQDEPTERDDDVAGVVSPTTGRKVMIKNLKLADSDVEECPKRWLSAGESES